MKLSTLLICLSLSVSVLAGTTKPIVGWATYYTKASAKSEGTSGTTMASNKPYDESKMTCALPFHPPIKSNRRQWGKSYRVVNIKNGKSVIVKHYDYGPGKKARSNGVVIDLTPAAFKALGAELRQGRVKVRVERVR